MRRSFAFLAMLLLGFAFSCRQVSETGTEDKARDTLTRIVGHMEKGQGKQVFLEEMGARAYLPIDTASCDESDRFEMAFHPRVTAF